jgi:Leucine-rich repeat (LRR) protein
MSSTVNASFPQLNYLRNMQSLEHVKLCYNDFDRIDGGYQNFRFNRNLKIIALNNNRLDTIVGLFCSNFEPAAKVSSSRNKSATYLPNLLILNLSFNRIHEITVNDFNCLFDLRELRLDYNDIQSIALNSFKNLNRLQTLYLNNNPLLLIYPGLFNGLQTSLNHLIMNFNTVEETLIKFDFEKVFEFFFMQDKLRNLKYIDMSRSKFERVSINLATFLLTDNKIKSIVCYNCTFRELSMNYRLLASENENYIQHISNDAIPVDDFNELSFMHNYWKFICPRIQQSSPHIIPSDRLQINFDFGHVFLNEKCHLMQDIEANSNGILKSSFFSN